MDWIEWVKMLAPAALTVIVAPLVRWSVKRGVGDQISEALAPMREDIAVYREGHAQTHAAIAERLHDGEVRFARLDTTLGHLPTREDMEAVSNVLAIMRADLSGLAATSDGIRGAVAGLQETVNMLVKNEIQGTHQ